MSAGTGIQHSEFNPSKTESVHFLQIWIEPREKGIPPGYEQRMFPVGDQSGEWILAASPDGREGSATVRQDAQLWVARLKEGDKVQHRFASGRQGWIQVARGAVECDEIKLEAGDGASVSDMNTIAIRSMKASEILLFDMK